MRRNFGYEGINVGVESEYPEDIVWLSEFLCPSFLEQPGQPDVQVRLETDRKKFTSLLAMGPSGEHVDAYILDKSVIRLPVWKTSGPEFVLYDGRHQFFYLLEGHRVSLICKERDPSPRISLMRVVREFAMGAGQRSGGRFLHASAFSMGGKAAIITGQKEAGKTSLLTYMLSNSDADFLANDRLLVKRTGDHIRLRGMPTIVSLRSGTLGFFPELLQSRWIGRFESRLSVNEWDRSAAEVTILPQAEKRGLSCAQFCSLLGCQAVGDSSAAVLVFPRQTGRAGGISLRALDKHEARKRLADCLFDKIRPNRLSDVFTWRADDTVAASDVRDDVLCEWLSCSLTAYDCLLGIDAYDSAEGAELLARAVRT